MTGPVAPSVRTRRTLLVAVSAVVALLLIGLTVRSTWQDDSSDAAENGATVAAPAECDPVRSAPAKDNRHIDGRPVKYPAPPASGNHSSRWAVLPRPFYTTADRPDASVLVHNLEHGYNILWYDPTVAADSAALEQLEAIAAEYRGSGRDPADAFVAAPWTAEDGGPMPAGRHYALTHWYADPEDRTASRADEVGYTKYCATVSAGLVRRWMAKYPLQQAPEGFRVNM